ncbi:hypothetical protein KQ41_19860 [Lysinibacillus fusiformis]|uniref:contact-dependent growth inhibition system immunity protein n=1 Tax=Lysinibacillus fusiformis TaxID=28031 RepID=UPI0005067645|nr:contact-dependent growth inhibition system immunity protein [Lysinibacillus fusiformis]KGA81072.1 hypothetical protein KQ41_19860 [Lysinibacillus fusiformis]
MLSINNHDDPVFQFLAGTFHQDIESPEDALQELILDESKEYLEYIVVILTDFIKNEYSDIEKNEYIQSCTDGIYFPILNVKPVEWLNDIIKKITKAINIK